ncbi:MAG: leucine-rich repeat domain-containing protein [Rickettsiales bacterium]|jgi:hypothetical protein|nr:leucine-rich repeat domain-containing protein [Rickettsiales bacterium]
MKNKGFITMMGITLLLAFVISVNAQTDPTPTQFEGTEKENPASDFSYDLTADGQGILIKGYTGGPGSVVVPAKIEDFPVLEIGDGAFDGSSFTFSLDINTGTSSVGTRSNEKAGITSITIPNTVRKIGTSAFANTAITKFYMPDSVTEIVHNSGNSYIFSNCNSLTEIRFSDNVEVIPRFIFGFGGLPSLKKVNLPKNLKMIASYAFAGCGELTELIIPNTLTSLEFVVIKQNYYGGSNPKYPFKDDPQVGFEPAVTDYEGYTQFNMFNGCSKLPLATRRKLRDLGYLGEF